MEIHYRGHITKKDFLHIIRISKSQSKWQRRILGAAFIVTLVSAAHFVTQGQSDLRSNGLAFLMPLVFTSFPWWMPYVQATAYNQKTNIYRNEVHGIINDREVVVNSDGVHVRFQWNRYTGHKIDKELLVLYCGGYMFHAFKPAMFGSSGDWETFVAMAKSKTQPG